MTEGWIVIPNWKKFQHYGKRRPVWIKLYLELNDRDDWRNLTYAQRGLLVSIWIEYVRAVGQLRVGTGMLQRMGQSDHYGSGSSNLKALNDAGFIHFSASKPAKLLASLEEETEREEEKEPLTPHSGDFESDNNKPEVNPRAAGTNPRALGTNPRAIAKQDREQRHAELVARAAEIADTWEGTDSAEFDERIDRLEQVLEARLSFAERDDLWEKAFSVGF